MTPTPEAELELTLTAVRAAGMAIMGAFRTDLEVRHKSPEQPVTDADLEADAILAEHLRGSRPAYGWLSEETVDRPDRLDRDRVWVVDPIDGTRSFIAGYPEFAVSVGLVERGRVIVGVVHNPATAEVLWAVRGGGAYRVTDWTGGTEGAEALRMEEPARSGRPLLLASRSEIARGEFDGFGEAWAVRPWGSTAWKLAGVAAGAGHAFISRGPKSEWDVVAGALIVEEAGGDVTDLRGDELRYNRPDPNVHGIVAGTPSLHRRLLERTAGLDSPRLGDTTQ